MRFGFEPSPDDFKWELYNVNEDFSQANNPGRADIPQKLKELQDAFDVEAKKYQSLSAGLEPSLPEPDPAIRPSLTRGRTEFTYYPGMVRIPEGICAKLQEQVLGHSSGGDDPECRSKRDSGHYRWSLWRLGFAHARRQAPVCVWVFKST